jgi:hypothetical protein
MKAQIKHIGDLYLITVNGIAYLTGTEEYINSQFPKFANYFNF